jgi:hypothetical protein
MFAEEKLQELLNVSTVTDLLDTYDIGVNEYPMLMRGHVMPESWGPQKTTINYYQVETIGGGLEYGTYQYYINCRAAKEPDSRTLAQTVFNQLNRLSRGNSNAVCAMLQTVPPENETDNFNTIIEVSIKTRGGVD